MLKVLMLVVCYIYLFVSYFFANHGSNSHTFERDLNTGKRTCQLLLGQRELISKLHLLKSLNGILSTRRRVSNAVRFWANLLTFHEMHPNRQFTDIFCLILTYISKIISVYSYFSMVKFNQFST